MSIFRRKVVSITLSREEDAPTSSPSWLDLLLCKAPIKPINELFERVVNAAKRRKDWTSVEFEVMHGISLFYPVHTFEVVDKSARAAVLVWARRTTICQQLQFLY